MTHYKATLVVGFRKGGPLKNSQKKMAKKKTFRWDKGVIKITAKRDANDLRDW